jgi:two-component system, NtrC family, response regulator HydG
VITAGGSVAPEVESLLEAWSDPAVLLDRDYAIVAANRAYQAEYGERAQILGRHCYAVSHRYRMPCDRMGESCPLKQTLETGEPARVLHLHWTREGKEHEAVHLFPVRDGDGQITGFLEVLRKLHNVAARPSAEKLVGTSESFRKALDLLWRAAPSETTVLILGETGTGKEVLAKTVHDLSPRRDAAFVPLDCSGLTETLFESELFGHEKGSFTGATHRKKGLVEAAEGGTLFLDEVGDIPLALQVKLLRLLESGTYRRVGSPEQHDADFRLVCATHQDLEAKVRDGSFRADLYYRIAAFPVHVPPLRERSGDIPLLVESMLRRIDAHRHLRITAAALERLERYPFPGNVRELLNVLERAALLVDGDVIGPEHLPGGVAAGDSDEAPCGLSTLDDQERRYLRWAVQHHAGDNRTLADALGVSERTLYRKLRSLRGRGGKPS